LNPPGLNLSTVIGGEARNEAQHAEEDEKVQRRDSAGGTGVGEFMEQVYSAAVLCGLSKDNIHAFGSSDNGPNVV